MAKSRKFVPDFAWRGRARALIREGLSPEEVMAEVETAFPNAPPSRIEQLVREEIRRQRTVDVVTTADKRRNIDLGRRLGCRGKNARARWNVTIFWTDPETGESRQFNYSGETSVRGRLADLINSVIGDVIAHAVSKGYSPVAITSASTSGRSYYRINHVECV